MIVLVPYDEVSPFELFHVAGVEYLIYTEAIKANIESSFVCTLDDTDDILEKLLPVFFAHFVVCDCPMVSVSAFCSVFVY